MKKSLLSVALASALAISFTGCGKSEPKPLLKTATTFNANYEHTTNYNDPISNQPVTLSEFKNSIILNLVDRGLYANYPMKITYDKGSKLNTYLGRDIKFNGRDNIEIIYASGVADRKVQYPFDGTEEFMTFTRFEIPFNISGDNGKFTYKTTFPNEYTSIDNSISFTKAHMPMGTAKDLHEDAKRVFDLFNNVGIIVPRTYDFKSEVDSKYDQKSIEANFKRLLTYGKFVEVDGKKYQIAYKISPYRGGSKIEYTFNFSYTLTEGGRVSIEPEIMNKLKQAVEKIVND